MNRLIKLQLRNIFSNRLFYVCLILSILTTPILGFVASKGLLNQRLQVLPEIILFLKSGVDIVSIIFIALFSCFDFNEGTTKNIIARGYSRIQVLFSKYISILIALFIMFIIVILFIFVLFIENGLGYVSDFWLVLINCIIHIVAITIIYSTISFVLEKNGSAIVACVLFPQVVTLGLPLLDTNLKLNISRFWIDNAFNSFFENPNLNNFGISTLIYLVYIIVFVFVGCQLVKNKEIK